MIYSWSPELSQRNSIAEHARIIMSRLALKGYKKKKKKDLNMEEEEEEEEVETRADAKQGERSVIFTY
jgi:hypothetical protein